VIIKKTRNVWTEEKVREEAKKYSSKIEFFKGNQSSYSWCCKHNIIDD